MTLVVTILSIAVAGLGVLVVGLLRSHAAILRRLHEMDGSGSLPAGLPVVSSAVPAPNPDPVGRGAADLSGVAPDGSALALRVSGTTHDTVLAFLSSDCLTCESFWGEFRRGVHLPPNTRLVIVTKGPDHESPTEVASLAPPEVPVILSSPAWEDYSVPGSPYVVHVEGPSGAVRGEGTGGSWEQVAKLLSQATGDVAFLGASRKGKQKPRTDSERERDTDRALLAAGIRPGDPSLYERSDGTEEPE